MKKEYIIFKDDVVTSHLIGDNIPSDGVEVHKWEGNVGIHRDWLDSSFNPLPMDEIISKGLVEDNRGVYYNKDDQSKTEILKVGDSVPEGFTSKKPKNTYGIVDKWDKDKWVSDKNKKNILFDLKKSLLEDNTISVISNKYSVEYRLKIQADAILSLLSGMKEGPEVSAFKDMFTWIKSVEAERDVLLDNLSKLEVIKEINDFNTEIIIK